MMVASCSFKGADVPLQIMRHPVGQKQWGLRRGNEDGRGEGVRMIGTKTRDRTVRSRDTGSTESKMGGEQGGRKG